MTDHGSSRATTRLARRAWVTPAALAFTDIGAAAAEGLPVLPGRRRLALLLPAATAAAAAVLRPGPLLMPTVVSPLPLLIPGPLLMPGAPVMVEGPPGPWL